ncbi:hypothetical protein CHCC14820_3042 [Bacillus paralicheniformis]|uniref:Uncharacterized protein n=1 Tax=Bacillus paralicheniformis TaxID=1648923 RepID=A0ABY3FT23_9BACI|nr:hypothetical protein SC10_B2orf06328 [Bacillus paralicheniformis]OLG11283.1 hypothetical protein B4123_2299 [Bacillus paralicheniformis]OLG12501.1 hypothetical protein B4123_1093 [Bacillus paralicheniformis]TWJ33954.1 hypothetical protein CHCC5027_3688 [Bacillus paralicheniformis]TWJ58792.1 hypothetical protein CHCC5022_2557 [Bacillus paralicheniformis]
MFAESKENGCPPFYNKNIQSKGDFKNDDFRSEKNTKKLWK